jgi:hypothetical protein
VFNSVKDEAIIIGHGLMAADHLKPTRRLDGSKVCMTTVEYDIGRAGRKRVFTPRIFSCPDCRAPSNPPQAGREAMTSKRFFSLRNGFSMSR